MPKIINAYSGNESVADSLKSLGDSMFGNQAQRELIRQNALAKGAENTNAQPFADAVARGDRNAMAYYGAMARKQGADVANFNLLGTSNHATGVDDPRLATAQIGAHEPIASTAVGQERSMQNARDLNDMTTARQLAAEKYKADNTPVTVYDNGRPTILPQSQAVQSHAGAPMSKDQVIAGVIQQQLGQGGPQPGPSSAAPPQQSGSAAPAQPGTPPGYIHPLVQEALGYGKGAVPYQHMQSGAIGQSYDGGKTINGAPAGDGWVPLTSGEAITQTRDNLTRDAAGTPLNVPADPSQTQAANEARATTGIMPSVANEANRLVGAIPGGPAIVKGLTGSPEVAPQLQQAEQNQAMRNQQTRAVLAASGGRQSVQAQKWVNENLPEGSILENPETEARHVGTIITAIKADYEADQRAATDRNTPPAERQKLLAHMHELQRVMGLWTGQAQGKGTAPAAAAPAGGSQILRYDAQGNRVQ